MYLSVIIPAYNEEKRITKSLMEIDGYLRLQKYEYEIIVVNDGSADKTVEVIRKLEPQVKNLFLIDNKKNQGKGFAVRQGFLKATGKYKLFADADNSVSINQIENFFPYFKQNYDILIASRNLKGSALRPAQPLQRRALGYAFSLIFKIFIGVCGIKDSQCGFKIFTKKSAEDILPRCRINRWSFDAEILAIAKKLGYKIKEVPVIWKNDSNSRVNLAGMFGAVKDLVKIKLRLLLGKYKN